MSGDSGETVAVAHYCEGAGHATRMLAVARGIEARGVPTVLAGGGPGKRFVERNGYREFDPRTVDFIGGYQGGDLLVVLRRCLPNAAGRVRHYLDWLDGERPARLVTDDITAALAAAVSATPYHYVSHDPAGFYRTAVERVGAWVRNRFALRTAETFHLPKVWRGGPTIPGTVEIPPIAPAAGDREADVDVLLVPSAFTDDPERLAGRIEREGRSVTLVGGDGWTVRDSLQPHVAAADAVVCSGYSTVMEAAVAGTPCVVVPHTSEQRGVADALAGTPGFAVARSNEEVVRRLGRLDDPDPYDNGTEAVVEAATAPLADRGRS